MTSFGLLILVPADPSDVVLHGTGPKVRAQWVTTGGVGESTEGRLVRVVGTITQAPVMDSFFGYKFFVDDGSGELQIFVNTQTGIDLSGLTVGQTVSVTGFSSQFETPLRDRSARPGRYLCPATLRVEDTEAPKVHLKRMDALYPGC